MSADSPAPSPEPRRRSSCLTSLMAFCGLIAASTVLLLLPTGFIGPVFVFGGIAVFGLFAFHYIIWGRWLKMELKDTEQPAEDDSN